MIAMHFLLAAVLPAFVAGQIYKRQDELLARGVYSVGWMLASMPVFGVAALGEVSRHIIDNWLYLGLIPRIRWHYFMEASRWRKPYLLKAVSKDSVTKWGAPRRSAPMSILCARRLR